jgi:O-antigen ligase
MKVKVFKIPLWLLLINLILSIPQFEWNKSIGWVRLLFIPILLLLFFDLLGNVGKKRIKIAVGMSWPIVGLLLLFAFQIIIIPPGALEIHLSGCIKFISWILLYLCALLSLTQYTALRFARSVPLILLLVFLGIVLQYPFLILSSAKGLGEAISSYGDTTTEKGLHGLFAAANEDANGMVALLPFCLYFSEQVTGLKKWILRLSILIYIPLILLFNGTRTALFFGFPITVFLFYFKFSMSGLLRISPVLLTTIVAFGLNARSFAEKAFRSESLDKGNFGWRILRLWIPATRYTFEQSPIFGFGSRGWDYVCLINNIVLPEAGNVASVFDNTPPHNVYIWVYVSWGIFGAFVYLSFLALLLKKSFQLSFSCDLEVARLGKASFCSIIAYCIWGAISNVHFESGWLILFSIGIIVASLKFMESSFRAETLLAQA